jgi:cysteine desulfurase
MTVYLDCNATSPVLPEVQDLVLKYIGEEFGNAGSRTHEFGTRAKKAVQAARDSLGVVVDAQRDEVVFTSGATESNNLAILGLAEHLKGVGRTHIITTSIEHKAVLEPIEQLGKRGFEVTYLQPSSTGAVTGEMLKDALQENTGLVSIMHANNETGVLQPIEELVEVLDNHPAFFHVDAAQTFGKTGGALASKRIDLISASGHKLYAPKGIGVLITRRRKFKRPPLTPLVWGGGQEKGLRPGTLPVALIVGFAKAAELAVKNQEKWQKKCLKFREQALEKLIPLDIQPNGDPDMMMPHVLNFSVPGIDSEALIVALKEDIAISNGSACTSQSYTPSHVLKAMGLSDEQIQGAVRLSWCHSTEQPDWDSVIGVIRQLL